MGIRCGGFRTKILVTYVNLMIQVGDVRIVGIMSVISAKISDFG